jgi:small subunit ribosomal protein S6
MLCLCVVLCCRDEQLAKFEAYLNKEGCLHINALVRSRSRMAYPMKG